MYVSNYPLIRILILLFVFTTSREERTKTSKWVQDLDTIWKREFNTFQTIVMINGKANDKVLQQVLQSLAAKVSFKLINFIETKVELLKNFVASRSIQTTTRFLIILPEETDPKESLEYMAEISGGAIHPRCLLIFQQKIINPEKLLHFAWSKRILDLTILELMEISPLNSTWNMKTNLIQKEFLSREEYLTMHWFNPYKRIYSRKKFFAREIIFPNKLDNLEKFEMKVSSAHSWPYVNLQKNSSGHTIKVSGLQVYLRQVLAKVQNFVVSEVSYPGILLGRASCQRNKSTGILYKLYHNEFHFFTTSLVIPSGCNNNYANTFAFENENLRYFMLVPITRTSNKSFSITTSLILGSLTICLIIFLCISVKILPVDSQFWSFFSIFQMLLGIGISTDPKNSIDRILFPFTFVGFMILSSEVFSLLTDIEIMVQKENALSNLNDVNKSDLTVFFSPNGIEAAAALDNDELIEDLLQKTHIFSNEQNCIRMVAMHKNVTCILKELIAKIAVSQYVTSDGFAMVKIVPEVFMETPKTIMMEPNFPSAFTFEKNMNRLTQTGLKEKWFRELFSSVKTKTTEISLMQDQSTLLDSLIWILCFSYVISIIAFFGELLMEFYRNRKRKVFDIATNHD